MKTLFSGKSKVYWYSKYTVYFYNKQIQPNYMYYVQIAYTSIQYYQML